MEQKKINIHSKSSAEEISELIVSRLIDCVNAMLKREYNPADFSKIETNFATFLIENDYRWVENKNTKGWLQGGMSVIKPTNFIYKKYEKEINGAEEQ